MSQFDNALTPEMLVVSWCFQVGVARFYISWGPGYEHFDLKLQALFEYL
jgi:hypothetical protein